MTTNTTPTASDLIHNARDEYGHSLDAFLVGWFSTLLGADEVAKAIDAYEASR